MSRGDYEVSVRIEKDTASVDAYGGETATESNINTGLIATKHFYSRGRLERFEGTPSGPGTMTITRVFFKLLPPFPSLDVSRPQDYRVVEEVSGLEWPVQHIRTYSRTMQIDCEKVA